MDNEAAQAQELKNQYERVKTSINKLSESQAHEVSAELCQTLLPSVPAKPELLKKAEAAFKDKEDPKALLDKIERAVKKNSK